MSELFTEVFSSLPRQGPGSEACTRQALKGLRPYLPPAPAILDIGCGSGCQTLTLAQELPAAHITAVDLSPEMLRLLQQKAATQGLVGRIETVAGDMGALTLEQASFDLIWSEGAIYILGFEAGLAYWKNFLRPGGCLAISHIAWLSDKVSPEAQNFWQAAFPQMTGKEQNRQQIEQAGYTVLSEFVLPQSAWWQDYYTPLQAALENLPDTSEAQALSRECQAEIELYRHHASEYGYVFWLLKSAIPGTEISAPGI